MDTVATGLTCPSPNCDGDTRVIDTTVLGDHIRRERICKDRSCRHVFTTIEDVMGTSSEAVEHHDGTGLPCPACGGSSTVKQTRRAAGQVRRRRICLDCDNAFKTKERPDR